MVCMSAALQRIVAADRSFADFVTAAKARGDANDDWQLTRSLMAARGVSRDLAEVVAQFERRYEQLRDGDILNIDVTCYVGGYHGDLSETVLGFQRQIVEGAVCWKVQEQRPKQRPTVCQEGFYWNGEQFCLPKPTERNTSRLETTGARKVDGAAQGKVPIPDGAMVARTMTSRKGSFFRLLGSIRLPHHVHVPSEALRVVSKHSHHS